jgi:hypothetical protein
VTFRSDVPHGPTLWLIVHRPQLGRDQHAALRGTRRSEMSVEELARWLQPGT